VRSHDCPAEHLAGFSAHPATEARVAMNPNRAYRLITIMVLLLAGSTQAAVASLDPIAQHPQLAAGDAAIARGDLAGAAAAYRQAEQAAGPATADDYFVRGRYRIAAAARSRLAYVSLQRGDRSGAGRAYLATMEQLRADYQRHLEQLDSDSSRALRKIQHHVVDRALDEAQRYAGGKMGRSLAGSLGELRATAADMLKTPPPTVEGVEVAGQVQAHVVRIPVIPDAGPLRYIGKFRRPGGSCTGSLVGPGLALTNAHCLFPSTGGYDGQYQSQTAEGPWSFRHEWLYDSAEYPVLAWHTHEGASGGWDGRIENDWAVLELGPAEGGQALPQGHLDSLADARDLDSRQQAGTVLFLAGYSSDLNHGFYLSMHWGCQFRPDTLGAGRIDHNCDSYPGASGSPILQVDARGQATLAGIHAGHRSGGSDPRHRFFGINPRQYHPTLSGLISGSIARRGAPEHPQTQPPSSNPITLDRVTDAVLPVLDRLWR
jgi:V8-like Glu-specific endopeptidase